MKELHMKAEMLEMARTVKSAEDLKKLAQEHGIILTDEAAQEAFERLNTAGELADDELEEVAGGPMGKHNYPGRGENNLSKNC